jgi:hypothetical protein
MRHIEWTDNIRSGCDWISELSPSITDYDWLDSDDCSKLWKSILVAPPNSSSALLKWLRSKTTIERAAILMEQVELLPASQKKFSDPECWYWAKQLLEQSSDEDTSSETARDFPINASIVDLCCGAGADAVFLAKRGLSVRAFDSNPIACSLARHNIRAHNLHGVVELSTVEEMVIDHECYVHIDPDRRPSGKRTSSLEGMSPGWETIERIRSQCQGMSIKLAPGLKWNTQALFSGIRVDERAPDTIRFLSKQSSVRQQRWCWGLKRWPSRSVVVSMFMHQPALLRLAALSSSKESLLTHGWSASDGWFHECFEMSTASEKYLNGMVTGECKSFIGDYDPGIRAAEVAPCFAERYQCNLLDSDHGFLTSADPAIHPMCRWFRIEENLPLDRKKLKEYSRSTKTRTWELKSRGIDLDLELTRKGLHIDRSTESSKTIFFTKLGNQHRAIVATEVFSMP